LPGQDDSFRVGSVTAEAMAVGLAPVGRETVQDRVYGELRRALIGGLFAPGQVLTIRQLSDALMTSTMPVREALGRLISEQALEALPSRQIRVPPITLDRLTDLLRARTLIEGEAIALAAPRMTAEGLERAATIMAEWEALRLGGNPETVDREVMLNQAFHFEIYRACGSAVLIPMIESLWLQSGPCTRAAIFAFSEAGEKDASRYHHAILEALRRGDAAAARVALIDDISRPFAFLRSKLDRPEETP
jgi:DNA-binding GntR family transcriptional regulator